MSKKIDFTRPDKLITLGIKTLGGIGEGFYSSQKQKARANAELTFIGDKRVEEVQTQLYTYNEATNEVQSSLTDFLFLENLDDQRNYWLNFHGVHETGLIKAVGTAVRLERLTLRQILDTTQRPKLEEYQHYLFINIKSIARYEDGLIDVEQISFVLTKNLVISFQEMVGDHFTDIRDKMENDIGFIRVRQCDYLLNQLLDAVLDEFFEVLEKMNQEIALLEKEVFNAPTKATLIKLETLKTNAQLIKKSLNPMKEALQSLMNTKSEFILPENYKFFKDLSSATSNAIEESDALLRALEGLSNIYFASLSQNMNEVMKVLTIMATIFIPLTFIAGIYGMNFKYIPELELPNGYFYTWGVMIIITVIMVIYFKRKKWM